MLDLSEVSHVIGANHWSGEINQLYRPSSIVPSESQNIVYFFNSLRSPKYLPVALKEWFSLVKVTHKNIPLKIC